MPVDFKSLPSPLPKQKKFSFLLWIGLLFLMILIGFISTLSYSFFNRVSDFWFISGSLTIPVFLWIFCLLYCLYLRLDTSIYRDNWNAKIEKERQKLIEFAKCGLYVIDYSLETHHGKFGNGMGVANHKILLSSKQVGDQKEFYAYSTLPIPDRLSSNDAYKRIHLIFAGWLSTYQSLLKHLSPKLNIHVRLFIDTESKVDELEEIWAQTLGAVIKPASFEIEDPKNSTTFIESWLDQSQYDTDLLLVISAHLFHTPDKNEGEFASLLLLAGEKAIADSSLSDFRKLSAKIYRSEQTQHLNETLDKALLWGGNDDKDYDGIWISAVTEKQQKAVLNYFNEIKFQPNNFFNVDDSIGIAGDCAYWLSLTLAVEKTLDSKNKQLVLIGKPKITASVVACPQLS